MGTATQAVIEMALFGGVVAGIGFGLYLAFARRVSRIARRLVIALVAAAVLFCAVVVAWDSIAGTGTSTESFVILIAAFPLLIAVAVVTGTDRAVQRLRGTRR